MLIPFYDINKELTERDFVNTNDNFGGDLFWITDFIDDWEMSNAYKMESYTWNGAKYRWTLLPFKRPQSPGNTHNPSTSLTHFWSGTLAYPMLGLYLASRMPFVTFDGLQWVVSVVLFAKSKPCRHFIQILVFVFNLPSFKSFPSNL